MFTGIIEQIGVVAALIRGPQTAKLAVSAGKYLDDCKTGHSVAVNGVCLTVTSLRRGFAEFDLSSETLKKSNLGDLKIGDRVNLEKAVLLSGRLGGHMVTGHIDGVGEIRSKVNSGDGFELSLSVPSEILRYLVPRGSIAVDGVSLTVADYRDGHLRIAVIPQTGRSTILADKAIGDKVNIEVDLLSKYIEKHLGNESKGITEDTMMRVGFLPMGWVDN
jgi:riboflavin synthase